jgi:ABC-type multidrug transport system fused ATPase/permease subunit
LNIKISAINIFKILDNID